MTKCKSSTESGWSLDPKTGEMIDPDDAPELTKEWFAKAEIHVGGKLVRRGRPPINDEAKERVTLRLDPELLKMLRRTGKGWQTRAEAVLRHEAAKRSGNRLMPPAMAAQKPAKVAASNKSAPARAARKPEKPAAVKRTMGMEAKKAPLRSR